MNLIFLVFVYYFTTFMDFLQYIIDFLCKLVYNIYITLKSFTEGSITMNKEALTFKLRKPIQGLDQFCYVFNDLPAKCDLQLQDITENKDVFSYVSISFEIPDVYTFVFNRDLNIQITGDDLLAVNDFRHSWFLKKEFSDERFFFTALADNVLHLGRFRKPCKKNLDDCPVLCASTVSDEDTLFDFDIKLKSGIFSSQWKLEYLLRLANIFLKQGGNFSISPSPDASSLVMAVYLCHPSRPSMEFYLPLDKSAKLKDFNCDFMTKLNLASHYGCNILLSCHGDCLSISVYPSKDEKKLSQLLMLFKMLKL